MKKNTKIDQKSKNIQKILFDISKKIVDEYGKTGRFDQSSRAILATYVENMEAKNKIESQDVNYLYNAYMLLGKYGRAARLAEENVVISAEMWPTDRLTIAEFYYTQGFDRKALLMVPELTNAREKLPSDVGVRLQILLATINPESVKDIVTLVSGIAKVSRNDAEKIIEDGVLRLREARKERGITTAN